MSDISIKHALAAPVVILLAMLASAASVAAYTGVDGTRVFWPYFSGWATATLVSVMIWAFVETTRMAMRREDAPVRRLAIKLGARYELLVLPLLIFPLFLGAYTWAKASIPLAVGYPWESFWADLDRALLGSDGWRIARAVMPSALAPAWTYFYAMGWGFVLMFSSSLIAIFANRRFVATFFTAMMLSWLIGGFVLAYGFSAAGPVFAHLVEPALADRFAPLRADLLATLGPDNILLRSQHYLASGLGSKIALKGAGISAMPSMHIATATIIALAAWKTRWRPLALLFGGLIFFGSVYLGYHYAVDAPVAAAVAALCWRVARRMYGTAGARPLTATMAPEGAVQSA